MHKTTIMLPQDLKLFAEQEAQRRGVSLGEVIRIALRELTAGSKNEGDPLFKFDLVYTGPCKSDLSTRHDDYLYGES